MLLTRGGTGVVRELGRLFWLGAASLVVVAVTTALSFEADRRDDHAVLRARELGRFGRDAYTLALDREDRVRGYLLARDETAITTDAAERAALFAKLDSLANLDSLVGMGALIATEDSVVNDVRRGLSRWDTVFVAGVFAGAPNTALLPYDAVLFKHIRADFAALRLTEDQSFAQAASHGDNFRRGFAVLVGVEIVLIVVGFSSLRRRLMRHAEHTFESQSEIVDRLAGAAEFRDNGTGHHTRRVGDLSARMADAVGFDAERVEEIRRAAALHDVGKIGVPDGVLLKEGSLSEDEEAIMRQHTVIGARILADSRSPIVMTAARIARNHHEKWDGSGYPDGLAGERIPIEARIVAVADAFDALLSDRPQHAANFEFALREIEAKSGSHFDPTIVAAFVQHRCYLIDTKAP